VKKQKTSD